MSKFHHLAILRSYFVVNKFHIQKNFFKNCNYPIRIKLSKSKNKKRDNDISTIVSLPSCSRQVHHYYSGKENENLEN